MQLAIDTRSSGHVVVGCSPGEVRLRDRTLRASAIVTVEHVEDWPVATVADLTVAALDRVLALRPAVVLLATGARQQFPDPALYASVQGRGVGFEVMEVGAACRTYNVLVAEDRRVALALVLAPR